MFLSIYPKEMQNYMYTKICYVNVYSSCYVIAKKWKQLEFSSASEWIQKLSYTTYLYTMEYHSVIKRNKLLIQAETWMAIKSMMLCEGKRHKEYILQNSIGIARD